MIRGKGDGENMKGGEKGLEKTKEQKDLEEQSVNIIAVLFVCSVAFSLKACPERWQPLVDRCS